MKVSEDFQIPVPAPWESAEASLAARIDPVVDGVHPCSDCLAVCCYFVLAESGLKLTRRGLRRIGAHLDYEGMVVWIGPDGGYTVGIVTPCRYLGRDDCACTVHEQVVQPDICQRYDARNCWYRPHLEADDGELLRVDGARWAAFRERIKLGFRGVPKNWPDPDELTAERRFFITPALLQFDIGEYQLEPDEMSDLLYFLNNFRGCSVARTPERWWLLYQTRRDLTVRRHGWLEVRRGRIGGFPPDKVFWPTPDVLYALLRELGNDLYEMGPEALKAAVDRPDRHSERPNPSC